MNKTTLLILTLLTLFSLGCGQAIDIQTATAKARIAEAAGEDATALQNSGNNEPTPVAAPVVQYEFKSTGNTSCDNILQQIYNAVNAAVATEEKAEKDLLEVLKQLEKAQTDLEQAEATRNDALLGPAGLAYNNTFAKYQQTNTQAKAAREGVKQQKRVLATAKSSCGGSSFGDNESREQEEDAAKKKAEEEAAAAQEAAKQDNPSCKTLENSENELERVRERKNKDEDDKREREDEKDEKEDELEEEEAKDDSDQDDIDKLNEDITELDDKIDDLDDDINNGEREIDRLKAVIRKERPKCETAATQNIDNPLCEKDKDSLERDVKEIKDDIKELEDEKDDKEDDLREARDEDDDEEEDEIEDDIEEIDEKIDERTEELREKEKKVDDWETTCA